MLGFGSFTRHGFDFGHVVWWIVGIANGLSGCKGISALPNVRLQPKNRSAIPRANGHIRQFLPVTIEAR